MEGEEKWLQCKVNNTLLDLQELRLPSTGRATSPSHPGGQTPPDSIMETTLMQTGPPPPPPSTTTATPCDVEVLDLRTDGSRFKSQILGFPAGRATTPAVRARHSLWEGILGPQGASEDAAVLSRSCLRLRTFRFVTHRARRGGWGRVGGWWLTRRWW